MKIGKPLRRNSVNSDTMFDWAYYWNTHVDQIKINILFNLHYFDEDITPGLILLNENRT